MNKTSTSESVLKRLDFARGKIEGLRKNGNEAITTRCEDILPILCRIEEEARNPPPLTVALVGTTGAGKSTLLNAILGARILPVSGMSACTAAISEVGYSPSDGYFAEVEFISAESWQQEIDFLVGDIEDGDAMDADPSELATEDSLKISREATAKIKAVYKLERDQKIELHQLEMPDDIKKLLGAGRVQIAETDIKAFKKTLKQYLASKFNYWPLVKTVKIHGPFECLANGITLVDLPGINDPNAAREKVTHDYLKMCRFVWVIFNVKRGPTKDITTLLQTDDFLRQIVMDGRANAMTFVGTATDDIDLDGLIDEFDLDEDISLQEAVATRNNHAKEDVRNVLSDLSMHLTQIANTDGEVKRNIAKMMKESPVFAVSSKEYMRLEGMARGKTEVLDDLESTEIPDLKHHLQKICDEYGEDARSQAHHRQINNVLQEVVAAWQTEISKLKKHTTLSEKKKKEAKRTTTEVRRFLEEKIYSIKETYTRELELNQSILAGKIEVAVERGRYDMDRVINMWGNLHWATLRAVTRRGGVFVGTTGKHDLPGTLSKPILDHIAYAWVDFFSGKLENTLEMYCTKLIKQMDASTTDLLNKLHDFYDDEELLNDMDKLRISTEKSLTEMMHQATAGMRQRIQEKQRILYEGVPRQITANMAQAFAEASQQRGTGMKKRMIDILRKKAHDISTAMFDDSCMEIMTGVRSLCDWLNGKFVHMGERIEKHFDMASGNMLSDTKDDIGHEIEVLNNAVQDIREVMKEVQ